ncbi:MAG: hypothetical protein DSZ00_08940, partial [Gammaproteobacteria bacterium]
MTTRSFPVFYCDFLRDLSISSSKPEPLAADRLVPLAEQLLVAEDNDKLVLSTRNLPGAMAVSQ